MYKIIAQPEKNLIIMQFEGFMKDDLIVEAVDAFKEAVNKMSPGFSVINDVSKFKPVSQKGTEVIQETQKYAIRKGMKRTVRVSSNEIVRNQWRRKSNENGLNVLEAKSLEEALILIEEDKKS
jgi:hypothetical protein